MSALSHRVRQPQQVRRSVCGVVVVVSYLVDESAKEEKGGGNVLFLQYVSYRGKVG